MKMERPRPTRADAALLRNTVLKLTAATRLFTVAVVLGVALVWWFLLHKVIAFGRGLDYSGLQALGAQVMAFVEQYSPFFWWAVVALCTLIIAYFLYGFAQSMHRQAMARRVSSERIAFLTSRLSGPALQVLGWSWHNRREPITVGVLQHALNELRHGRAERIEQAAEHARLLESATSEAVQVTSIPHTPLSSATQELPAGHVTAPGSPPQTPVRST